MSKLSACLTAVTILLANELSSSAASEIFISPSPMGDYKQGAVSANGYECAKIGADILRKGGSAVDAAIAATLCDGIACPHSLGIGGGFFMTIYDASTNNATFLDARETAPAGATKDMYVADTNKSITGGLAVGVPGEIKGYWEAHKKFGKLPWKDLFEANIALCKEGSYVTKYVEDSLKEVEDYIKNESTLAEIFINPATKELWKKGDRIKRPQLAETLQKLADSDDPVKLYYEGEIADNLVRELGEFKIKGILTKEDFHNYSVKWKTPISVDLDDMKLYSAPPPGSGVLVAYMLNILDGFLPENIEEKIMWQRIVEAFKNAYAMRTKLGDPDFLDLERLLTVLTSEEYAEKTRNTIKDDTTNTNASFYGADLFAAKEDHGTGNLCVLAPDGSAVSITSTINHVMGARIRSKSTGIIFNDQMDDFCTPSTKPNGFGLPPSESNFIEPGKRPMSSMSPSILVDSDKRVRLIIGGSGGSKITTGIAMAMTLHLLKGYTIKQAIDAPRLHHQLDPMELQYEKGFSKDIIQYLNESHHAIVPYHGMCNALTGIASFNGTITANADFRREGSVDGF